MEDNVENITGSTVEATGEIQPDPIIYYCDAEGNYLGGFQGDTGMVPDGAVEVPPPMDGRDKWDGEKWIPYVHIPPVVSRFQLRAALMLTPDDEHGNLLTHVEYLMNSEGSDQFVLLAWREAQEFKKDSSTIQALVDGLGLDATELSDLLRLAATIES